MKERAAGGEEWRYRVGHVGAVWGAAGSFAKGDFRQGDASGEGCDAAAGVEESEGGPACGSGAAEEGAHRTVSGNNSAPTVGDDIGTAAPSSKGTGVVSTGALSSVNVTRSISLSSTLDAHFANGSFEQAISLHRGVLQFGEMTNDLGFQTKACVDLGCIFERLGEHMEALSMHTKSLDLAAKAGNEERQGIAYNNMGNANFRMGRFAEALELLLKGFEKFKTIGDESRQAIAMGNIGCAQFSLGRLNEAFLSFEASLRGGGGLVGTCQGFGQPGQRAECFRSARRRYQAALQTSGVYAETICVADSCDLQTIPSAAVQYAHSNAGRCIQQPSKSAQ